VRRIFFSIMLLLALPLSGLLMTIVAWAHAMWYDPTLDFTIIEALEQSLTRLQDALNTGGLLAWVLVALNYLGGFGIVIVVGVLLTWRWNVKRVFAFVCGSYACIVVFAYPRFVLTPGFAAARYDFTRAGVQFVEDWEWYLLRYPWYALALGLAAGWLAAQIPMFKPGKQYWLLRGLCPKCHYDLKGAVERGCPECGWDRQPKLHD